MAPKRCPFLLELTVDEFSSMKITLRLPEKLLTETILISGKKNGSEAVRVALEDYIRRNALKRLLELPGKIGIEDVSEDLEKAELASG